MKIRFRKGYILVIWPWFVRAVGHNTTGTLEAKGAAIFPFIFVRGEEYILPWLINHERIHFRQQLETLFIGLLALSFVERLYAKHVLKQNKMDRYLYVASEQEAYLNMHNLDYLKNRAAGRIFHYVKHKRKFELTGPGQLEFTD